MSTDSDCGVSMPDCEGTGLGGEVWSESSRMIMVKVEAADCDRLPPTVLSLKIEVIIHSLPAAQSTGKNSFAARGWALVILYVFSLSPSTSECSPIRIRKEATTSASRSMNIMPKLLNTKKSEKNFKNARTIGHFSHLRVLNVYPTVKEKYGSDAAEDDDEENDSESDESEDEEGEELTPVVDAAILRTLARIKRKDPEIYNSKSGIFEGTILAEDAKQHSPLT